MAFEAVQETTASLAHGGSLCFENIAKSFFFLFVPLEDFIKGPAKKKQLEQNLSRDDSLFKSFLEENLSLHSLETLTLCD